METMASSNSEKCTTPSTRKALRAMNAVYANAKQAIATGNQRMRQRRGALVRERVVVGSVDACVALMGTASGVHGRGWVTRVESLSRATFRSTTRRPLA